MPKDQWRSVSLRKRYGPVRQTGSRQGKKKRSRKQKHTWVSIGACHVKSTTDRTVLVCTPEGKYKWIPRAVLMNGAMHFKIDQVLKLICQKWYALKEGIACEEWTGRQTPADKQTSPNNSPEAPRAGKPEAESPTAAGQPPQGPNGYRLVPEVEVLWTTDKALLIRHERENAWIPKSIVWGMPPVKGEVADVWMKSWFVDKGRLDDAKDNFQGHGKPQAKESRAAANAAIVGGLFKTPSAFADAVNDRGEAAF